MLEVLRYIALNVLNTVQKVGGVEIHRLRYIALNVLNTVQKVKAMSKMSKIDKVHIRGVRLCMVKDVKDGKRTYTHILAHNFLNT